MTLLKNYPRKTREKILALCALAAVVSLAVGWNSVIRPAMVDMAVSDSEKAAEARRQTLIRDLEAVEKKIADDEALLSTGKEITWLIEALNQMAQESDVTLVSAAPVGLETRAQYDKTAVRLEARATYHQLGDFASRIENSKRFIKVLSARIERPLNPDEAKEGKLNAFFSLAVFNPSKQETS
ncbi:MAG TPA: type 4a pilus biogenesis protein PilO [Candidatus Eisenbacteria bacterium]|nr:type 4a pilus biogenesis protein PilO [Candidatus Eisenbacteria bacterium]